jgi:hypothetical protein
MSPADASLSAGVPGARSVEDIAAQGPLTIRNCNRLGRIANPPHSSLLDRFRSLVGRLRGMRRTATMA